ncbi:MAG: hypothetical protein HC886_15625, partial [Leptolyngbyaceae cyanobacterium SM1_1_3]|nr:hypothetical protein [Leptolyngbyaceae cyanobacterium SM1_1_3]
LLALGIETSKHCTEDRIALCTISNIQLSRQIWLRWFDQTHAWIPTAEEQAAAAQQALRQEQCRTQSERQRAERLAEKLRSLGIDPDQI